MSLHFGGIPSVTPTWQLDFVDIIRPFINPCSYPFILPFIHLFIRSLIRLFIRSSMCCRTPRWRRSRCCGWTWSWTRWRRWRSPRSFRRRSCSSANRTAAPSRSSPAPWWRTSSVTPSINSLLYLHCFLPVSQSNNFKLFVTGANFGSKIGATPAESFG